MSAASAATGPDRVHDYNIRQDVILIDRSEARMSREDVAGALAVYMDSEALREMTRALEDARLPAAAVDAALRAYCDQLYAEKLKANAEIPWLTLSAEELKTSPPLFRWPHARKDLFRSGIEPDSQENTKLMLAYMKKILEKVGASLEPPYAALTDVLAVAAVISDNWDAASWQQVWTLFRKFLALIGHEQQHEYLHVYLTQNCYFSAPKHLKAVLSSREAAAVRGKVLAMETEALAFLDSDEARGWVKKRTGNGHSLVQNYLLGLFTVGGKADWVPARCDPANLVYKTPDLDVKKCKGFIEAVSETECRIRYVYLNKVLPQEKKKAANLDINVGATNPPLAKLLFRLKSHMAEISTAPTGPFYMFSKEEQFGNPIKSSDYSKRGERLAKSIKLDGELAEKLKNCTAARYLSAKEDALFTDKQVEQRCRGRGQQPPVQGIAKAHYAAGSLPEIAPGATVTVSGLQSPRVSHLNDHFGTVLEYLPEQERYRVEFSENERGLVRPEHLSLVLSAADIARLQAESEPVDETDSEGEEQNADELSGGDSVSQQDTSAGEALGGQT
eukprot:COSAG06_NODE_1387_length_9616_cov_4.512136_8_plen_561_part_00